METNVILMTREEVAEKLGVKPRTIDFYRQTGKLKAVSTNPLSRKAGFMYRKDVIDALFNKNEKET